MTKREILSGLIAGLVMAIVGMIISQFFLIAIPDLKSEYENTNLFRSWSDPIMSVYFVHPFIVGLILAWIWDKTRILFSNGVRWKNAWILP